MLKKVKMKNLVGFYHGLHAVSKLESPNFKFTYAVVKNLAKVEVEVEPLMKTAADQNKKLIEDFGKRNEAGVLLQGDNGYLVAPESQKDFMAAQKSLNDMVQAELEHEVEIDIHEVPMEESIFPVNLKPEILKAIMLMVSEG